MTSEFSLSDPNHLNGLISQLDTNKGAVKLISVVDKKTQQAHLEVKNLGFFERTFQFTSTKRHTYQLLSTSLVDQSTHLNTESLKTLVRLFTISSVQQMRSSGKLTKLVLPSDVMHRILMEGLASPRELITDKSSLIKYFTYLKPLIVSNSCSISQFKNVDDGDDQENDLVKLQNWHELALELKCEQQFYETFALDEAVPRCFAEMQTSIATTEFKRETPLWKFQNILDLLFQLNRAKEATPTHAPMLKWNSQLLQLPAEGAFVNSSAPSKLAKEREQNYYKNLLVLTNIGEEPELISDLIIHCFKNGFDDLGKNYLDQFIDLHPHHVEMLIRLFEHPHSSTNVDEKNKAILLEIKNHINFHLYSPILGGIKEISTVITDFSSFRRFIDYLNKEENKSEKREFPLTLLLELHDLTLALPQKNHHENVNVEDYQKIFSELGSDNDSHKFYCDLFDSHVINYLALGLELSSHNDKNVDLEKLVASELEKINRLAATQLGITVPEEAFFNKILKGLKIPSKPEVTEKFLPALSHILSGIFSLRMMGHNELVIQLIAADTTGKLKFSDFI